METAEKLPSYDELLEENRRLKSQLDNLYIHLIQLKKHVFGTRSERLSELSSTQQLLFGGSELGLLSNKEEEINVPAHIRRKGGRKPLSKELPRERIEYEPEERTCSCCGEELSKIGEEITEELDYVPAKLVVREHVKIKRACSKCKKGVYTGKLPLGTPVIEGCRAGAGLLTHIIVSKHCDHIPLNRQEQIFSRLGLELSRQRMSDWIGILCERYLIPVAKAMKREILKSNYIYADETGIKVKKKGDGEGLHMGYLWGLLSSQGDVYFEYDPSRSSKVAKELLEGYSGYVHTDGYVGYNPIFLPDTVTRVGCFAHVRRKFIEVQSIAKKESGVVLRIISELYKIEKKAKRSSFTFEQILEFRLKKSKPLMEKLYTFLLDTKDKTLPKHPLVKAINYTLNQWKELSVFLENGMIGLDNNPIERQIRPIAVGRHNWLFAGSHNGARYSATIFSLVNTCKLNKINPTHYFNDILTKINHYPNSQILELTPRTWAKNQQI